MSDPYGHCKPQVACSLRYGTRLRYAKAFASLAASAENILPGTFLPHELELIKEIETNVIARAKTSHETEKALLADPSKVSDRTSPQQSIVNGE